MFGLINIPGIFGIIRHGFKGEVLFFDRTLLKVAGWDMAEVLFFIEKIQRVKYWGLLEFADSFSLYVAKKDYKRIVKALSLAGVPVNVTAEDLQNEVKPGPESEAGEEDKEPLIVRLFGRMIAK